MLHFEGSDALRGEQYFYAGHEIVDVRHMRQHIVGGDQIRSPTLADQFVCILRAEKLDARVDVLPEIAETKADLIKWMFIFWIGQLASFIAIAKFIFHQ